MEAVLYTLITTHITIVCVTLYLHRGMAHRSITFNPIVSHMMRFWLWLTTGMVTKEWVAIHRKHHRYCEKDRDPHSPVVHGLWRVLFGGVFLYVKASKYKVDINTYGSGAPADWVERNIYSAYPGLGISILLLWNIWLFGWVGPLVWLVQMAWIPFWAAGVVNGIGHWWGYRNGTTRDNSRNILPFGLVIGGEELHNNHHLDPRNPKLSRRWFEVDIGWGWLKLLTLLRLAKANT